MIGTWKTVTVVVSELEQELNALAGQGYAIYSVLPLGVPEAPSNIPRDRKTLAERASVVVLACKPFEVPPSS